MDGETSSPALSPSPPAPVARCTTATLGRGAAVSTGRPGDAVGGAGRRPAGQSVSSQGCERAPEWTAAACGTPGLAAAADGGRARDSPACREGGCLGLYLWGQRLKAAVPPWRPWRTRRAEITLTMDAQRRGIRNRSAAAGA
jgi:hypothetical protein